MDLSPQTKPKKPKLTRATIRDYFTQGRPATPDATPAANAAPSTSHAPVSENPTGAPVPLDSSTSSSGAIHPPQTASTGPGPGTDKPIATDIGCIFSGGKRDLALLRGLDDQQKRSLLTSHWMPGPTFVMPHSVKGGKKKPQNVFLNLKHISEGEFQCFKFSQSLHGVVCVPCALFASESADNDRHKVTSLGQLVNTPLQKYTHLTGSDGHLSSHLSRAYHHNSQMFADNFLVCLETQSDIAEVLDTNRQKHVQEQRERLIPIIKTIVLCGRLGIGYRGHRDDGTFDPDSPVAKIDGNFRALLGFRVDSGDTVLAAHLRTAGKNATYISKTTQNELIDICGNIVAQTIVASAQRSRFFSVLADETTDASHHEQLCICIRYVAEEDAGHQIREEFLQFATATDLTGAGLAAQISDALKSYGLDLANLEGQGYDGAAAMSGHINGVQQHIRNEAPLATYVHCGSHALNLVLNSAGCVHEIRDMFAAVHETTNFINSSGKRREIMAASMGPSHHALKTLCETRFVERHDALLVFCENFEYVVNCLEQTTAAPDRKTADRARSLFKTVTDSSFIVALCCAKKVVGLTVVLSRSLQKIDADLVKAIDSVNFVMQSLKAWRSCEDDEQWIHGSYGVYSAASKLADSADITLSIPRLAARQTKRNNVPGATCEQYYKRAIWYPYLDATIQSMGARFSRHQLEILKMAAVIPSIIAPSRWADIVDTATFYNAALGYPDEEAVYQEYQQWKEYCLTLPVGDRPTTPLGALDIIPNRLSNIKTLLKIFCTIPVTTCTAERAFSAMKILKNYLRSRTSDERLTGLTLMYIHPTTEIDVNRVVERFFAAKTRRLDIA